MSDRQQPQQDEVFVSKNLVNLQMFAPAPNSEGRNSNLQWGHYRGNPNITVWTGIMGDKKPIQARMDLTTFNYLVDLIKDIASGKANKGSIQNDTIDKREDPENKTRSLQSVTMVGRDADDLIWISVQEKDRPKIVFHFKMSDWHRISVDGEALTPKKASEANAVMVMENVLAAMKQHAFEWKERQRTGGAAQAGRTNNTPAKRTKDNDDSFFDDLP